MRKHGTYYRYALNIFKHHSMKTSDQQVFNSKNNHETHICLPTWYGWSGIIKEIELTRCSDNQKSMDSTLRTETHLMNFTIRHCRAAEELLKIYKIIQTMYVTFFNTIFVSSHRYVPREPRRTQVIPGSMNMGYISDTAKNRTHNLFRTKCKPIPLGRSDGQD